MLPRPGPLVPLLTLLGSACVVAALACSRGIHPARGQGPDAKPRAPGTAVYDPAPAHLLNRLHHALHTRETAWNGTREVPLEETTAFDPNDLDPFSWDRDHERGRSFRRGKGGWFATALGAEE